MILGFNKQFLLFVPLFLLSAATFSTLSNAQASDARADILQAADKEKSGKYVRTRFLNQMKKPFSPSDKRKKMLIIGDSHAQDFYNSMLENNLKQR